MLKNMVNNGLILAHTVVLRLVISMVHDGDRIVDNGHIVAVQA